MLAKKTMQYYSVRHSLHMTLDGQSPAHFLSVILIAELCIMFSYSVGEELDVRSTLNVRNVISTIPRHFV
jgi:hypothetical protein